MVGIVQNNSMQNHDLLQALPPAAQTWLTNTESLTKRLRLFTDNKIAHHLFFNDWDSHRENWIRRMEWRYGDEIWVRCVVTIPRDSLIDELKDINQRSIGEILFQDPGLTRSEFVFSRDGETTTRTSTFHFKQKPIHLTEVFLPAFFDAL